MSQRVARMRARRRAQLRSRHDDRPPDIRAGVTRVPDIQLPIRARRRRRAPRPVKVPPAAQPWADPAPPPLPGPTGRAGPFFLFVRDRVLKGQIGLAVLDGKAGTFQLEKAVAPSSGMIDTYLRILVPERASALMIRNTGEDGVRSEMLIEDAGLVAAAFSNRRMSMK